MTRPRPAPGFTLVEMMVSLAVLAVVVALVAPGFSDALQRSRLKSQGSEIANLLELAKSQALMRQSVTTTIATANEGRTWTVSVLAQRADGLQELRSVSGSAQVVLLTPTVPLAATLTTAGQISGDFRGVFTGYLSADACRNGDRCIHLRSPGDKYELRVGISAVGQVVTCAAGESFGGYPAC